jgi:hypothetical protein
MSEECLKKSLKWGLYKTKKVSPWVEVHAGALPMMMVNDGTWPGFPHVPAKQIQQTIYMYSIDAISKIKITNELSPKCLHLD